MGSASFSFTPVHRLLLDVLHQDENRRDAICDASFNGAQWQEFLHTAMRHSVSALLYHRLKTGGHLSLLPEPVQKALFDCYMGNAARNMKIFFCLKKILKAFHAEGIPAIALKGAHLAHTVYPNPSVREMSDIDLMVPPDKLKKGDRALQDLGYIPDSPSDIGFELTHFAHLPQYNQPGRPAIELHWTIIRPKSPCRFDASQWWEDTDHFQIGDADVRGLTPEWLLVHICTHISHQHGFVNSGLRGYCDIAEVLGRHGADLNWQPFENITRRSGVERGVYLTLLLARDLLGAKVPDEILKTLAPSTMDDQIRGAALKQCLSDNPPKNINTTAAEILQRKGVFSKGKGMVQRLFLPREIIARKYGLDPNSWYPFLYYPVRFKDLIFRHGKTIRDHTKGDKHITAEVQNVSMLQDWLSGK